MGDLENIAASQYRQTRLEFNNGVRTQHKSGHHVLAALEVRVGHGTRGGENVAFVEFQQ